MSESGHPVHSGAATAQTADEGPPPSPWTRDGPAAIVVFLVALPLCLGVALASGAPAMAGIIAGVVGGLLVAPISGAPLMVSGPAAGLTTVVLSAVGELGSFPKFCAAVVIAGVLQVGFGLLRLGRLTAYVPPAVIRGMLAAIGLLLILKQLPYALGARPSAALPAGLWLGQSGGGMLVLRELQPLALLIAASALGLLIVWPRVATGRLILVPGALLAVVGAVLLNALAAALLPGVALGPDSLVALPVLQSATEALDVIRLPDWSALPTPALWRIALTVAIVASLESLLSLDATDRLDPEHRRSPADRELVAQGAGNLVSGLAGGLPVTGVIARSAANIAAGARTRRSAVLHGLLLLVTVAIIPTQLNRIPLAVLAAILIHTGAKLARPALLREMWRQGTGAFVPFVLTVAGILATNMLEGIALGLLAAGALRWWASRRAR